MIMMPTCECPECYEYFPINFLVQLSHCGNCGFRFTDDEWVTIIEYAQTQTQATA